jgi:hypothetical protein
MCTVQYTYIEKLCFKERKKERKFIYLLLAISMVIKITTGTYLIILMWHLTLLGKYASTQSSVADPDPETDP